MANTYSAGVATAYGSALQGGYEGTYEEFCEQQAHLLEAEANAIESAESASASKTSAHNDALLAENYAKQFVGAPRIASTAAQMTDEDLIYVYTGSEVGYTNGNWYYYDGDSWEPGGVYNSTAFTTDTTLTVSGAAADAKVVGDLKSDVGELLSALINDTNYKTYLSNYYQQGVVHNGAYSNPNTSETITSFSELFAKPYPFALYLSVASGYKALLCFYLSDTDTSAVTSSWLTGDQVIVNTASTISKPYFCIEVRKSDNSVISPIEASSAITAYYSNALLSDRKKVINILADSTSRMNIAESCDINGNGHTINVGLNEDFGMEILGDNGVVVNVYDLTIKGGNESAVRVNHGATVNFYNCSFEDATNHGLSVVDSNTNCFDCTARNNSVDGFNYHNSGKNMVVNCYALNNGDDGISNHDSASLKIVGGRYIGNGKAGIASPTYGAENTDISDVYCSGNAQYGIIIHNDTEIAEKVIIQNAILDNSPVGLAVNGYQIIAHDVIIANCTTDKTVGNGGSITIL